MSNTFGPGIFGELPTMGKEDSLKIFQQFAVQSRCILIRDVIIDSAVQIEFDEWDEEDSGTLSYLEGKRKETCLKLIKEGGGSAPYSFFEDLENFNILIPLSGVPSFEITLKLPNQKQVKAYVGSILDCIYYLQLKLDELRKNGQNQDKLDTYKQLITEMKLCEELHICYNLGSSFY